MPAVLVKHRFRSRPRCLVFSCAACSRRRTRRREKHYTVLAQDVRIARQSSAMPRMCLVSNAYCYFSTTFSAVSRRADDTSRENGTLRDTPFRGHWRSAWPESLTERDWSANVSLRRGPISEDWDQSRPASWTGTEGIGWASQGRGRGDAVRPCDALASVAGLSSTRETTGAPSPRSCVSSRPCARAACAVPGLSLFCSSSTPPRLGVVAGVRPANLVPDGYQGGASDNRCPEHPGAGTRS